MRRKVTQLIFTYSKSTIEKLEKGVKYVQSLQYKNTRAALLTSLLSLFSSVCIVDFKQVNVSYEIDLKIEFIRTIRQICSKFSIKALQ